MKEMYQGADNYTAHIEASNHYFIEAFPDDIEASGSYGDRKISPGLDITYGITHSEDFRVAAIAVDVHILNDEPALLEFSQSLDQKDVLLTCLVNAIDPISEYFENIQDGGDELPKYFGLRLLVERRDFDDRQEEFEWAEEVESICYPVPVDKNAPMTAYLFTALSYKDTESGISIAEVSIGSMVFATGSSFGDDSGFPPYWSYAETVSVVTENEEGS